MTGALGSTHPVYRDHSTSSQRSIRQDANLHPYVSLCGPQIAQRLRKAKELIQNLRSARMIYGVNILYIYIHIKNVYIL